MQFYENKVFLNSGGQQFHYLSPHIITHKKNNDIMPTFVGVSVY